MKNIVIYHRADFDGIFSREIAKKFLPDAELIGWDYGDKIPDVPDDAQIYMIDISVEGLMTHPNLIWIDHHKSAIEKFPKDIIGYRIDGVAACRLAWQWFTEHRKRRDLGFEMPTKEQFVNREVLEPYAVRLAGEYDIWDKRDPNAELFQHGLRSQELSEQAWSMLLDNTFDKGLEGTGMEQTNSSLFSAHLLESGHAIQYFQTQQNKDIITSCGFDLDFEGLKFLACNHARFNSFLFTAGIKPEHDALFGFKWDGKQFSVSLYHAPGKEHHDLSLIASKYGGGGHKGACGFRINKLPFMA